MEQLNTKARRMNSRQENRAPMLTVISAEMHVLYCFPRPRRLAAFSGREFIRLEKRLQLLALLNWRRVHPENFPDMAVGITIAMA
jgi:hypothetical protein